MTTITEIFEMIKNGLHNIALCTGYLVLILFVIFILLLISSYIRERSVYKKNRKSDIKVPFKDYQCEKLGYTDPIKPAAFIIVDNLEYEEIGNLCSSLRSDYEIYAALLLDVEDPDKYISENIDMAVKNKTGIKRFIFSIPNGVNLHRFVDVSEAKHGQSVVKEYIYYTMYKCK